MSEKIPKEKLRDLYERSCNHLMDPAQCAIWLPEVCKYALTLLEEKEAREKAIAIVQKIKNLKRNRDS